MNGALGRQADVPVGSPDQQLADLARPPMWLFGLELDNQGLDLGRLPIGVAHRASGAVAQRLQGTPTTRTTVIWEAD